MKLSYEQLRAAVYAALTAKLGRPYDASPNWSVVATFEDAVIIERAAPKVERYPVTVAADGTVTLGDAEQCEIVYQALKESAGACVLGPLPLLNADKLTEAERKSKEGSRWAIVAIREGLSRNRTMYPADVLRSAAKLYEGVKVFWNHQLKLDGELRDPRDIAGFLKDAKCAVLEGAAAGVAITATMHVTSSKLRESLLEAYEAGNPDLYGLSHTAHASTERVRLADGPAHRVTAIQAVESVDVVSFPSAGGRVMRLVAGMSHPVEVTLEALMTFAQKLAALQTKRPDLHAKLPADATEAQVDTVLMEALAPAPAAPPAEPKAPAAPATPAVTDAPGGILTDADRSLLTSLREAQRSIVIGTALQGVNLPAPALEELRESLAAVDGLTPEIAADAVKKKVANVSKMFEGVRGIGFGAGASVEVVTESAEKEVNLLDDLLMSDAGPAVLAEYEKIAGRKAQRPGSHSIREAYVNLTGDQRPFGRPMLRESLRPMSRFDGIMSKRLVDGKRIVEGLLQTSTWAEVFGDSIARRMIAEYRAFPGINDWRIIASVVPLNDFRTQHAIRWGGYGDLPVVNQGAPYVGAVTPGDEEATFAASKRGYTEAMTWEALVNDDLGQIRQIPTRMGRAAARTLYKFVTVSLLAANPTCGYDATALFHANHGNLGSTALSAAQIAAAELAMANQTDMSANEKLGLTLSWLMVPTALKKTAWNLINSTVEQIAAQTSTEPNYAREGAGLSTLIVNPYLTDTTDWFVGCDKGSAESIRIGFLFGQEEPTIVIADAQNVGAYFSADKQELKLRHVYGGTNVDHRGLFGAIV